jgi:prepilin-type processing-associated H-X9-DG protein
MSCCGNLKFMGLAMHNYGQATKYLVPAYCADAAGHPMHSWRVLVLPFLEGDEFYSRCRLEEPWDSPHNRALAGGIGFGMDGVHPLYHCPSESSSDNFDATYVTFVGEKAYSPGARPRTFKEITDGLSNTIWLGEMADSGIPWMEPRDLQFDEMSFKIGDRGHPSIRSAHPAGGANVSFLDGSVRWLNENTDSAIIRALITVAGGEANELPP